MKEVECEQVANWIADIVDDLENETKREEVKQAVLELCQRFPVYQPETEMA
jgi:glycine hydroxymethyltransferase